VGFFILLFDFDDGEINGMDLAFGQPNWFGLENPNAFLVRISRFVPYVNSFACNEWCTTENGAQGCAHDGKSFK
jgi:hypothetical protein